MALMRIRPPAPALIGIKPRNGLVCSWEPGREACLYAVKNRIHHRLLERIDFAQLETLEQAKMAQEIRQVLNQLLEDEPEPLNLGEKSRLVEELEFEILGLGPLEPLLKDPTISDILVNRYDQVYIERRGRLELTAVRFQDNEHLLKIINKIVSNVGRRIDESTPHGGCQASRWLPGQCHHPPPGPGRRHTVHSALCGPTPQVGGFAGKR
jgi:hypothetical protein